MKKACVFLADGFEEIEGLAVVDLLRRGGVQVTMVSVMGQPAVKGSHGICVLADTVFEETCFEDADLLVLPGGAAGTERLSKHEPLLSLVEQFYKEGRYVAAICAAPSIFAALGILKGRKAIAHPAFEHTLCGAELVRKPVVVSEHVITGRGMGAAIEFGLKLLELLEGSLPASRVAEGIVYQRE